MEEITFTPGSVPVVVVARVSENEEGVIYTCPLRFCVIFTDAIMERRCYKELFVS